MQQISLGQIQDTNGRISIVSLKDALFHQGCVKTWQNQILVSNPEGYWSFVPMGSAGQSLIRRVLFTETAQAHIGYQKLKVVLDDLAVDCRFEFYENSFSEQKILFKNGVLDILSGQFDSEPGADNFRYRVNANYVKEFTLRDALNFKKYLQDIFGENKGAKIRLLESMAFLISPIQRAKIGVFWVGKPNTGKSLLLEVLSSFLNDDLISSVDLSELGRYNGNGVLLGKQLNVCSDYDSQTRFDMSFYKRATANEYVTFSNKYEQSRTLPFLGKLVFAGNALPNVDSTELSPFIDRLFLVYFPNAIAKEQRDAKMIDKLVSEKDVIISVAVNYALKGFFANRIPSRDAQCEEFLQQFINNSEPVKAFCNDFLEIGDECDCVRFCDVKSLLKKYCNDNIYRFPAGKAVKECIASQFPCASYVKKNLSAIEKGNLYVFNGIRWKESEVKAFCPTVYDTIEQIKIYTHRQQTKEA